MRLATCPTLYPSVAHAALASYPYITPCLPSPAPTRTYNTHSCVYSVKLLEDWRVLTADHAGWVRCWNSSELVGGPLPCLTQRTPFAPSLDDPASSLVDLEVGAGRIWDWD